MDYDIEFLSYIEIILNNKEYQRRRTYMHHEGLSVYEHSLLVAYKSYKFAKKHKSFNIKDITIGAVLHDFYYNPWQNAPKSKKFKDSHGFVHAREALENSKKHFPELINPLVEEIILRHMFPLNIKPPKHKEAWVVTYMDKVCSLDVLKHPKEYPKYLGFKKREKI